MAAKGLYPPGTVAEGDEPGLGQDLGTMLTNPSLLLTAAGILAPEESNIGGSWWRVGPRLRGLGGVMGAAREANQEQRFAGQLQKLGQQGLSPTMPPGQGGEASADPWSGMLPPGQDRQTFLSKLTPDMIRQIGANPQGYGSLVDKYAGAADSNQKKAALANAWYAQLKNTHPESVARTQALAQAEAGIHPSEKYAGTPASTLQTALAQSQADQKIEQALSGGLDVNNSQAVQQFLDQNRDVNAARLFSRTGNVVAANAFYANYLEALNKKMAVQGKHITAEYSLNPQTGEMGLKLGEGPIPMIPADIQKAAGALQGVVIDLLNRNVINPTIAQALQTQLVMLMRNPNPQQYHDLNAGIMGMYTRQLAIEEQRPFLVEAKVQSAITNVETQIKEIDAKLAKPEVTALDDEVNGRQYAKNNPNIVTSRRALMQQRLLLQQGRSKIQGATSLTDLQRAQVDMSDGLARLEADVADTGMRHRQTGKTWSQVLPELKKQKDMTPEKLEALKKIFLSESQ